MSWPPSTRRRPATLTPYDFRATALTDGSPTAYTWKLQSVGNG